MWDYDLCINLAPYFFVTEKYMLIHIKYKTYLLFCVKKCDPFLVVVSPVLLLMYCNILKAFLFLSSVL
jgi:hypothetical protein